MNHLKFSSTSLKTPSLATSPATAAKAETLMMAMQTAVLRDFDSQMRHMGRQIKLVGDAKRLYREGLSTIQEFLAQNTKDSRKDGKRTIKANFAQLEKLCGAFSKYECDLEKLSLEEMPMSLSGNSEKHDLDAHDGNGKSWIEIRGGKFSASGVRKFFEAGIGISDPGKAREHASQLGDDDTNLPFYYGHTDNQGEDGFPLFDVFTESLDRITDQIQNELSDLEERAEELGIKFNQIASQRKAALESLEQTLNKRERLIEQVLVKN